jgi:hypothetical protein
VFEKFRSVIEAPHDYATIWLELSLSLWQKYHWFVQVTQWRLKVLWGDNLFVLLFLLTFLNVILYLHSSIGFLYSGHEFILSPFMF